MQSSIENALKMVNLALVKRWIRPGSLHDRLDWNLPPPSIKRGRQTEANARERRISSPNLENKRRKCGSLKRHNRRPRTTKEIEQIFDRYGAEHPLTVGGSSKPMARPTILAKYDRKEISLNGQFAKDDGASRG